MGKLRVSVVEYLNTAPLVWGFTDGPLSGRYELSFTLPALCADSLRQGHADIAIIPAVEYQRIPGLAVLPGIAVAAKSEVRSILVIAKCPIDRVRRIALDSSSRSSAALVRLLAEKHWQIPPEYLEVAPDPSAMLAHCDAALLIGDPALRIALKMDELAAKQPSGEQCCQGDPKDMPIPGFEALFVYDVGYQWRQMTGFPCVLAIWAARPEVLTPQIIADFAASRDYGLARLAEIADAASLKLDLPPAALERYLGENINYTLDAENLAGLKHYFQRCALAGLISQARPLQLASPASSAGKAPVSAGKAPAGEAASSAGKAAGAKD